jgi:hypothetical protein
MVNDNIPSREEKKYFIRVFILGVKDKPKGCKRAAGWWVFAIF